MTALHLTPDILATINDRVRSSAGAIYTGETYWPRRILKQPHETVLPSLNGLARLIAADGNFLEDAHLGEQYSRQDGFFGTAHMKARIIDAIGLLSLREAGVIEVNGPRIVGVRRYREWLRAVSGSNSRVQTYTRGAMVQ